MPHFLKRLTLLLSYAALSSALALAEQPGKRSSEEQKFETTRAPVPSLAVAPRILKSDLDLAKLARASAATPTQHVWELVVRDVVAYVNDVPFSELQTKFEVTTASPRPIIQVMAVGDIREINGRPVKGTYIFRAMPVLTTPNPSPQTGFTLAESTRIAQLDHTFEIFQEDGVTPIGSMFAFGLGLGPPTPGAPPGAVGGSLALIGGTGPYLAMRGQINTGPAVDGKPFLRFASGAEHPAVRRVNGGGITKFLMHLIPLFSRKSYSWTSRSRLSSTPRIRPW